MRQGVGWNTTLRWNMFIICKGGHSSRPRWVGGGRGGVYMCSPGFLLVLSSRDGRAGFAKSHLMSQIDQSRKTLLKWWGPSCSLCARAILHGGNYALSSRHEWHMCISSCPFLFLCIWHSRYIQVHIEVTSSAPLIKKHFMKTREWWGRVEKKLHAFIFRR